MSFLTGRASSIFAANGSTALIRRCGPEVRLIMDPTLAARTYGGPLDEVRLAQKRAVPRRRTATRVLGEGWLALPLAALFAVTFVAPLFALSIVSLFETPEYDRMGLGQYVRFFSDTFSLAILGDTFLLGFLVTLLCLPLAYAIALTYVAAVPRVRTIITFVILLPLL